MAFSTLWVRAIANLCRAQRIPLVLGNDTTFFEKRAPNPIETASGLGTPFNPAQQIQFDTHRRYVLEFSDRRIALAEQLGVTMAGPGPVNDLGFVDEFHYDADGTRSLSDDFAAGIAPLL